MSDDDEFSLVWPVPKAGAREIELTPRLQKQSLYKRLETLLERQLELLESKLLNRKASVNAAGAADRERDTRTLTSLLRLFEKLRELGATSPVPTGKTVARQQEVEATEPGKAHIRAELARKISRLLEVEGDKA